ncbi:MAG: DUF2807 domain-containing protein [Acidimicrobiia bacterium]|nr:DUF2807 domain-containing protein [Acidimicrobiia bacterium]
MHTKAWLLAVGLLVLSAGCSDVTIGDGKRTEGSGTIVTESREVSGFDAVRIFGSGDITIDVTGSESLSLTADDNLMELLTTEVSGSTLDLSVERGNSISPSQEIEYDMTAADLTGLSIFGSADIKVTGADASDFDIEISGAADIQLVGVAESLSIVISGAGDIDASALVTKTGSVRISGAGDIVMNATDELDITISGSGNVEYIGNPTVNQTISGTGSVSQL